MNLGKYHFKEYSQKYKYILICPYFGKLPTNFDLWQLSCLSNDNYLFVVITDDASKTSQSENVIIVRCGFKEFREYVQSKFDFKISLKKPYKLCDFKPTYGYLLDEYIQGFQYWGYCDLDLIFGDLSKFMPKEDYCKISHLGHFCLYRNTKELREAFMSTTKLGYIDYKDILSSDVNFGFDEIGDYGINDIFKLKGYSIYPYELYSADISCARKGMAIAVLNDGKFHADVGTRVFAYEDGKVLAYNLHSNTITKKEYAYVHLQKRKMNNNVTDNNRFLITPDQYMNYSEPTNELIAANQGSSSYLIKRYRMKFEGLKRRIRRKKYIDQLVKRKGSSQ